MSGVSFDRFYHDHYGVTLKSVEKQTITTLVDLLNISKYVGIEEYLKDCYVGYSIPQISKELDCLWVGENSVINVELKSDTVPHGKIINQLKQNKYYLKALNRSTNLYAFVLPSKELFMLEEDSIRVVDIEDLVEKLLDLNKRISDDEIDKLFDPSIYLVSPFNNTEEFLKGEYFFTDEQDKAKKYIVKNKDKHNILALEGSPGTGKSLLLYDMAKELKKQYSVLMVHNGSLNCGHDKLKINGWDIIKYQDLFDSLIVHDSSSRLDVSKFDFIMIDEAQRAFSLKDILDNINALNKNCILSFDRNQLLKKEEECYNNPQIIENAVHPLEVKKIDSKVRTNTAVQKFIKAIFYKRAKEPLQNNDSVCVTRCSDMQDANAILKTLQDEGYVIPKFTPNNYCYVEYDEIFCGLKGGTAHGVIGQEFDKVASVILPKFYYNNNGRLACDSAGYYDEVRMLYQIVTRARKKLYLVIIDNDAMYDRLHDIINGK